MPGLNLVTSLSSVLKQKLGLNGASVSRNLMRKVTLSLKVMRWLVHVFIAASKEQRMSVRRWKTRDHYAELFCTLKYNENVSYSSFIALQISDYNS